MAIERGVEPKAAGISGNRIKLRWDCWVGIFDVFEMPKFGNKFGKDLLVNG